MAAKLNKDMLLKHRFWVMIGVTGVLTLAGIFYLQLYGGEAAASARKVLLEADNKGAKATGAVSQAQLEEFGKVTEEAKKAQNEVWKQSYRAQAPLFTWAPKVESEFEFLNGKFATDIKIHKADDKSWPEDTDSLLYANLIDVEARGWAMVKTRKGVTLKILPTENVTITEADGGKTVNWGRGTDFRTHRGKWLAITYQNGKYFGDPLVQPLEQDLFADTYKDQIRDILLSVDPVKEDGSGVVQLHTWLYNSDKLPLDEKDNGSVRFIRYVAEPWNTKSQFSKEAWIAQENIWIQREIYQIIKRTNDEISQFKPVDKLPNKKGEKCVFKNANFAVELILFPDSSLSFKITNIQLRRQKLDLNFRVKMAADRPAPVFRISAAPLAPGASHVETIKKGDKEFDRTGIYGLEQVLTWETAAVKRIDHISIGSIDGADVAHTHKNYVNALVPFDEKDKAPEEKGKGFEGMTGAAGAGSKAPPGGDKSFAPPSAGGGLGGGAGANKTVLAHGLWTDRYLSVTDQSRRIPVAVSLIVDQDHVDRVLTQFNNSKLRFLESQVLLNHYTGSLAPNIGDAEDAGKAPGGFGIPPGFGMPPGFGPKGFGPGNPMAPGGAGPGMGGGAAGGADLETNMEVVVYGIMTLYQRYPPRPAAEKKQ